MIKRSIIFCFFLFAAYTLLLKLAPHLSASQHLWQNNVIRGQRYVYNKDQNVKNAIVGSSMSEHFIMDSLPHMDNLSFAGLGVMDGLNLLRHKTKLPDTVFIEMNVILRKESENFSSTLYSPINFYAAKYIVSLRAEKQPLAIIANRVTPLCKAGYLNLLETFHFLPVPENAAASKPGKPVSVFDELLDLQIKGYSEKPDPELLREQFELLRSHVLYLKSQGSHVIFYEMPVNCKLTGLDKAVMIRNTFYSNFPKNEYHYVDMPDCSNYRTLDGVHLDREESLRYTDFFREQVKQLK